MTRDVPIACTLAPTAYADRMAWVTTLNRTSLRAYDRRGRVLRLTYAADALAQVRELVRLESTCCAFLDFHVEETAHAIHLRIEAPDADGADVLLAPFLAGAASTVVGPTTFFTRADAAAGEPSRGCTGPVPAPPPAVALPRGVPGVVAATGVAAAACGVCCVLPIAVPALAVSTVGSVVTVIAGGYWWAIAVGVAALVVAVAYGWSMVEPYVSSVLRS